jgi:long-chain-fatty-acid--CoA ligase ACSBG
MRTGDVGEERGLFTYITGRIKELIITGGGENVAPVLLEQELKEQLPALSNVVMIGDKQKYLIAVMTLKLEPNGVGGFTDKLTAEAAAVDPACKTFADAEKSAVWKTYMEKGVAGANSVAISRAQNTRKYKLIPGDLSPVGEIPCLTPTMKLKRDVFQKKYFEAIKACYGADLTAF